MKTYEALARTLVAEGVEHAFGIVGDATLQWYGAMADGGVRMIDTRQEIGAVAMAEGYAQVAGEVGVAHVTSGPGLVQAGLAIANAARSGAAVVVVAGDNPTTALSGLHMLDQRRFVEACGARFVAVRSPATAADDVRRAMELARTEGTAVVLNAPMDIQAAQSPLSEDAFEPRSRIVRVAPPGPSDEAVAHLVSLIRSARRPIVLAGRGAVLAGAAAGLVALAERVGAATATTLLAKGYLDEDPFCLGIAGPLASAAAEEEFAECDLVLAFGSSLDRFTMVGAGTDPVFPKATVVSINLQEPTALTRAHADAVVVADVTATTRALATALDGLDADDRSRTSRLAARLAEPVETSEAVGDLLHPARAMAVLERHLSRDRHRIVVGSGHFFSWPIMHLRRPVGARFQFAYAFGSIGLALPIGIGAALADPTARVVVVEGDGSIMETIQELDTAGRYGIGLTVVVMNDEQLGAERFKGQLTGMDPDLLHVPTPDLGEVARALGGRGTLATDEAGMDAALLSAEAEPGPFVLDARIDPTVLCDMYRKLHFDLPNVAPHQRLG